MSDDTWHEPAPDEVCGAGVGGGEVCWLWRNHDGDHDPDGYPEPPAPVSAVATEPGATQPASSGPEPDEGRGGAAPASALANHLADDDIRERGDVWADATGQVFTWSPNVDEFYPWWGIDPAFPDTTDRWPEDGPVRPLRLIARDGRLAAPGAAPVGDEERPPCGQCGPGYRIGDDGCRHTSPGDEGAARAAVALDLLHTLARQRVWLDYDDARLPQIDAARDEIRAALSAVSGEHQAAEDGRAALAADLLNLCDDEWLRRRDRYMELPGARRLRNNGASAIEHAAHDLRRTLAEHGFERDDAISESYRQWMIGGRDEGEAERAAAPGVVGEHREAEDGQ